MTDEGFDQQGASLNVTYELNDNMTLKYIFGYGDFDYTYTVDYDYFRNSEIANSGLTVLEDVGTPLTKFNCCGCFRQLFSDQRSVLLQVIGSKTIPSRTSTLRAG